ncbi:hypothetical protein [Rhodococcus sp. 06-235-1A]|nr:hypothetical protein [Rhodococcus sp. 06-235-1A]
MSRARNAVVSDPSCGEGADRLANHEMGESTDLIDEVVNGTVH